MYPTRELTRLAAHKAVLCRNISASRTQCAEAATRVARPLAWLDRVVSFWRQLPSAARMAALPLGWTVLRSVLARRKTVRSFVRWVPLVVGALRLITSSRQTRGRVHPAVSVGSP